MVPADLGSDPQRRLTAGAAKYFGLPSHCRATGTGLRPAHPQKLGGSAVPVARPGFMTSTAVPSLTARRHPATVTHARSLPTFRPYPAAVSDAGRSRAVGIQLDPLADAAPAVSLRASAARSTHAEPGEKLLKCEMQLQVQAKGNGAVATQQQQPSQL